MKAQVMRKGGTRSVRRGRPPSHGMTTSRTYNAWLALRAACDNPRHPRYHTTGGKGVTYPEDWNTFEGFLEEMGEAPDKASLKRRDTTKDYSKNNCYWND